LITEQSRKIVNRSAIFQATIIEKVGFIQMWITHMKANSRAGSNAPHGGTGKILKSWPVQTSKSFTTPNV